MTAFLRFWRSLPVLSVGLAIALESYFAICGGRSHDYLVYLIREMRGSLGEGVAGVLVGAGLLMSAAAGAELGRALLLPIRLILGRFLRKLDRGRDSFFGRNLRILVAPTLALALQLFDSHTDWISSFYKSCSLSQAKSPEFYALVRDEWEYVFSLLRQIMRQAEKLPEEFWRFTYFTNVTQEQAVADLEQARLESVQLSWLAISLTPLVVARFASGWGTVLEAATMAGILSALLIPVYLQRKLTFAVYVVNSFALVAQFGDAAEVTDREAQ